MSFKVGDKRPSGNPFRLDPPPPKRPRIIDPQEFVAAKISPLNSLLSSTNTQSGELIFEKISEFLGVEKEAGASALLEWCVKTDQLDRAFELIDSCGFPNGQTVEQVDEKRNSTPNGEDLTERVSRLADLILKNRKLDKFQTLVLNRLQSPSVRYCLENDFGRNKLENISNYLDCVFIVDKKYVEAFRFLKDPEIFHLCGFKDWCFFIKNLMESMIEDSEEITNAAFDQLPAVLQNEPVDIEFLHVVQHMLKELGKTSIAFRISLKILCDPEKRNLLNSMADEDFISSQIVTEDDCELAIQFAFNPSTSESIKTFLINSINRSKFNFSKYISHDPKIKSENQSDLVEPPLSFDQMPQQKRAFIGNCMKKGLSNMFPI